MGRQVSWRAFAAQDLACQTAHCQPARWHRDVEEPLVKSCRPACRPASPRGRETVCTLHLSQCRLRGVRNRSGCALRSCCGRRSRRGADPALQLVWAHDWVSDPLRAALFQALPVRASSSTARCGEGRGASLRRSRAQARQRGGAHRQVDGEFARDVHDLWWHRYGALDVVAVLVMSAVADGAMMDAPATCKVNGRKLGDDWRR